MTLQWMGVGVAAGLIAVTLWMLKRSWFRVEEGYVGVLTRFGAVVREGGASEGALRLFRPGMHRKAPWDRVLIVEVREQTVDLSGEKGLTAMAADGTNLRFDSILRFETVEERLADYLFGMKSPREHITGLFTCLLRNEIANFGITPVPRESDPLPRGSLVPMSGFGALTAEQKSNDMGSFAMLRRERTKLNLEIAEFCRQEIGDRYGITFNAVDLVDILPPEELAVALNAVIHAHSEAHAAYFREQGDCQQRELAAEEGLVIARTRAAAIEREMLTHAENLGKLADRGTLAPYVLRRRAEVLADARATYLQTRLD